MRPLTHFLAAAMCLGFTLPAQAQQLVVTDAQRIQEAELATVMGGPADGKRADRLQVHALFYNAMPTVVTVSKEGRIFLAFPRWEDPVGATVAEIRGNELVPFPDAQTNPFHPDQPRMFNPSEHLVSVQSVVVDAVNRLWILDTGSIDMKPPIEGGPKLWAYDLATGERIKAIAFDKGNVIRRNTYLNDVRIDNNRGAEGMAFITDSGEGGIIVVDLATGEAWRKLDNHESTRANPAVKLQADARLIKLRPENSPFTESLAIHADGIALSPDGGTLYYTPLTSRTVYAVPTEFLADKNSNDRAINDAVRVVAEKASANDGIVCDAQGRIYTTDFEDNCIRRIVPSRAEADPAGPRMAGARSDSNVEVLFQDERLLWPDSVWIHDGHLYIVSNQLNRQAKFHNGEDKRQQPYVLFRYPLADGR